MLRRLVFAIAFASVMFMTGEAQAVVDCNGSCDAGKVMVSFTDGADGATCECFAESSNNTEVDPYVSEGDESPNAEATDGNEGDEGEGE